MIVMKFGGTSVQDAHAMSHVKSIASQYDNEKILIVSSACSGMTSDLLKLATDSVHMSDEERNSRIDAMRDRHCGIARELGVEDAVRDTLFALCDSVRSICEGIALLGECTPRSSDSIASFGELLSTVILDGLLQTGHSSLWFDARRVISTDSTFQQAQVDQAETESKAMKVLLPLFDDHRIVITQGFIGADTHGTTTTLGRGGSDFSAAIFGSALDVREIIIWTDVSGIASADPRIIPDARYIHEMSFDEARMLSFFGAKVLHPDTLIPALSKHIPVHVRNTFKSSDRGTTITHKGDEKAIGFRSVIGKRTVTCIHLHGLSGTNYHESKREILDHISHLTRLDPLIQSRVGDSETVVYDASVKYFSGFLEQDYPTLTITMKEYALLSAIGPNLQTEHSKQSVKTFYEILIKHDPDPVFFTGIQPNTLSALVQQEHADIIIAELHKQCT